MSPHPSRRLQAGGRLVLASHNRGKVEEFRSLLLPYGLAVTSAADFGLPEPEETEDSFVGNATLKARAASAASGEIVLADDSGFCVGALGGLPGIYSARWGGEARDFGLAMQRVRDEVAASTTPEDDAAWFVCVLCIAWPDGHLATFEGRTDGAFCWPPRGNQGHGYDPVFRPEGSARRYGEMSLEEKSATSHRARAWHRLAASCL